LREEVLTPRIGVSDGARTRDIQIHNLALYRLSYAHHTVVKF
jgi:hypothetical protein